MNTHPLLKSIGKALTALLVLACAAHTHNAQANSRTYTTNADFDGGTLFNVNHTIPDQLQLNSTITALPVMWIANGGEDTVSKIDTNTGRETARYRTGFGPSGAIGYLNHLDNPWAGPAPSRTAVDAQGNVYVGNRHFDSKQSVIVKILATGGIDRNGNGVIDTSSDINGNGVIENPSAEIKALSDTNSSGYVDSSEIQDERIAWFARVGAVNGVCRSLSIGPDGHIWVGLFNTREYYKISSVDGSVLLGPISVGHNPYGSLVDASGTLYGVGIGNYLLKMNTVPPHNPQLFYHSVADYGIALGTNGKVYVALQNAGGYPMAVFDPATSSFTYPYLAGSGGTLGISVDSNGDVFLSAATSTVGGGYARGATKLRADGSIIWSSPPQAGATGGDQRGAIVDSNNDVWTINRVNNSVSKFRGSDGAALGVFPVGNHPYTYSDASGSAFLQSNPSGNWTVVHDTGYAGTSDGTISWTSAVPTGAGLQIEVRAADTQAGLAAKTFVAATNGGNLPAGVSGRFIEVKATLSGTWAGQSLTTPILYDLTILTNQAPTVICPAPVNVQCPGPVTLNFRANDVDNSSLTYDIAVDGVSVQSGGMAANGAVSLTHNFTTGLHNVVFKVNDGRLGTSCITAVTVRDTVAPVVTCPQDIVVSTDAGRCDAKVMFSASATDNCGGTPALSYSHAPGSVFPRGTTTVTVNALDASGNPSTCSFKVTVNDTESPKLVCPADIVVNTDPSKCSAVVSYAVAATDNCAVANVEYSLPTGSVFPLGVSQVNVKATDSSGNVSTCTFKVTVVDNQKPAISCPTNITVNTDPMLCTAAVNFTGKATDNCGTATLTYDIPSGSAFPKGVTTVTATATDGAGNTNTCSFTVTVVDNEKPSIECPANIVVSTDPALCTAAVRFDATAKDNCGVASVAYSVPSGSAFPKGTTPVTVTVTDTSGLTSSCTFTVTVNDAEAPKLVCPQDITVNTDPALCTAVVSYNATASDNCGVAGVAYSIPSGSAFPKGTTLVTVTATDTSGNPTTCTFKVTVKDAEAPSIACPANITVNTDPMLCTAVVSYSATAKDNCGVAGIAYSIPSGTAFPKGTTTVTATVTDTSGNKSSCTFTVTVNDNESPKIACPPNIEVGNDPGLCSAIVSYAANASDNCAVASLTYSIAPGSVFPKGVTPVTVTATDTSGNKTSCTFTVTVKDTQAPMASCVPTTNPSGKNVPAAGNNPKSGQNPDGFYQLLGTDNCDAASALTLYVKDSGSNYVAGPFKSGAKVKITQAPGVTPNTKPMSGDIIAHIQLKGDALLVVVDAAGNTSVVASCLVAPAPK